MTASPSASPIPRVEIRGLACVLAMVLVVAGQVVGETHSAGMEVRSVSDAMASICAIYMMAFMVPQGVLSASFIKIGRPLAENGLPLKLILSYLTWSFIVLITHCSLSECANTVAAHYQSWNIPRPTVIVLFHARLSDSASFILIATIGGMLGLTLLRTNLPRAVIFPVGIR